jgi:sugar phosphate isomerase/epimerase
MEGGIDGFMAFAASLGLKYVEIRSERPYALPQDMGEREVEKIREQLASLALEVIVHSAVYDINIASLNPLIRKASIRQTIESVRLAGKIGAKIVVIHPGRLPKDYPVAYRKNSRINLLTSLNMMARIAGRIGVTLVFENSPKGRAHRLVATPQEHLYALNKVGSAHLGAALDTGHAHTWGLNLRDYIRSLGNMLMLVHLHDNKGVSDEHLALGKGNSDVRGVGEELQKLGRNVPVVLSMRSTGDYRESIRYLERMESGRGWGGILERATHLGGLHKLLA